MAGSEISYHSAEGKLCKQLHPAIVWLLFSSDRMLQMLTGVIMSYLPLGARREAQWLVGSLCGILVFEASMRYTNRRREFETKELPKTCSANVLGNVTSFLIPQDVNDNPPVCEPPFVDFSVLSIQARTTSITQLHCTDKDERSELSYSIVCGMEWMQEGARGLI